MRITMCGLGKKNAALRNVKQNVATSKGFDNWCRGGKISRPVTMVREKEAPVVGGEKEESDLRIRKSRMEDDGGKNKSDTV